MKLRESGMPEASYWESLFDVETILQRLGIGPHLRDVLEIGCGYGTFTVPVAQRISGVLSTLDIDPAMVAVTRLRAAQAGLANIHAFTQDAHAEGFGVPPGSQDACLIFNLLHCEEPAILLERAAHAVGVGGKVLVIHWRYDPDTPRGPAMAIRPQPCQIVGWAEGTGALAAASDVIDLPPWHYGLIFTLRHGQVTHRETGDAYA